MADIKKLYRSSSDRMLLGVCGGVADYLGIDANVVRLLWVGTAPLWGWGVLMYVAAAFLLPAEQTAVESTPAAGGSHESPA